MEASFIVPPHGNILKPLLIRDRERLGEQLKAAEQLPRIVLSSRELSDIIMLGTGAFSPLDGFMCKKDYQSVVEDMRMSNGLLWPIPVTLSIEKEQARGLSAGGKAALYDAENNRIIGILDIVEIYEYDKDKEAQEVFKTKDPRHPGVDKLNNQGSLNIGGKVEVFNLGDYQARFPDLAFPEDTRKIFIENQWKTVAAFQTRNPMHRSHEYLAKIALEVCDGLFINPIVGRLKEGDIPAEIRMKCYKAMIDNYFPRERVVLKVYPMEMRYAGPREAVLHAIIRQNFGCSHLIIGRDHAGVGDYYGPFDAQDIFDDIKDSELYIKPLKLDWTFWCYKCGSMASMKTCPHGKSDRLMISGTELRRMLSKGERPNDYFSRPEVIDILMDYYSN